MVACVASIIRERPTSAIFAVCITKDIALRTINCEVSGMEWKVIEAISSYRAANAAPDIPTSLLQLRAQVRTHRMLVPRVHCVQKHI